MDTAAHAQSFSSLSNHSPLSNHSANLLRIHAERIQTSQRGRCNSTAASAFYYQRLCSIAPICQGRGRRLQKTACLSFNIGNPSQLINPATSNFCLAARKHKPQHKLLFLRCRKTRLLHRRTRATTNQSQLNSRNGAAWRSRSSADPHCGSPSPE
jgi:hypothetical protein